MFRGLKVLCVIPARGGSKRLPGKNMIEFAGKPLISWTIEQALSSGLMDRVIVSTDDPKISSCAREFGAETPFIRPSDLASDSAGTLDVLLHAITWLEETENTFFDIIMLLPVTAPLRKVEDIKGCMEMLVEKPAGNVFSVAETSQNPYFNMVEIGSDGRVELAKPGAFAAMQQAPKVFVINGSVYGWWVKDLKKNRKLINKNSRVYVMPRERSVDIDDIMDLRTAECIFGKGIS